MFGQPLRHSRPGLEGKQIGCHRFDYIGQLEKKILGLHRILAEDPTITELKFHGDLEQEAAYLEDLLAEESARRSVEADWQKRVQRRWIKTTRFMCGISRRSSLKSRTIHLKTHAP